MNHELEMLLVRGTALPAASDAIEGTAITLSLESGLMETDQGQFEFMIRRSWCEWIPDLVLPLALIACLSMPGCSGDSTPRRSDDVVRLDGVHVLGTSESLAGVVDVQPGPGDTIWVLNNLEPYFIAFSPDGDVVRAWGKRGGGPGEVQIPFGLVRGPGGDVWMFDDLRLAVTRISAPEGERTELLLPDSLRQRRRISFDVAGMGGGRPWIRATSDGLAMAFVHDEGGGGAPLYRAEIVVLRPGRESARSLIALADRLEEPAARYGDAALFLPFPLWDLCADGRFVLYDPNHNTLRRFTTAGMEESPITLPFERRAEMSPDLMWRMSVRRMMRLVPPAQRPDTVEMRKQFDSQLPQMLPQFADVFPEYADLHCADAYWLQRFDLDRGIVGRGPGWLRVEEDGTTSFYELPERFTPFRFTRDRIWGVLLDDLDVPSIAWIDLR